MSLIELGCVAQVKSIHEATSGVSEGNVSTYSCRSALPCPTGYDQAYLFMMEAWMKTSLSQGPTHFAPGLSSPWNEATG